MTGPASTLQELLDRLEQYAARTAILSHQSDDVEAWSFAELDAESRRLAGGLGKAGLHPGDRVALLSPNRPEWVVVCFAIIRIGAIPVLLDAQADRDALARVMRDSGATRAFAVSNLADRFPSATDSGELPIALLDVGTDDDRSWRRLLSDEPMKSHQPRRDDPAVLFYTSGTSGAAKGVPLSHRNLVSNVEALRRLDLLASDDRVLLPLPLHHVYPFTVGMLTPLASGAAIVFPRSLSGPKMVEAMRQERVTVLIGVPRIYDALVSACEDRVRRRGRLLNLLFRNVLSLSMALRRLGMSFGGRFFRRMRRVIGPNLHMVVSGGAAIDSLLARKLEGLGWNFGSGYGLTETSPAVTFNLPGSARIGTVGRPVPGVEVRIAEPEEGRPHGEILVRGPNVFRGYWNMPEKTEAAFTDDGFFRTGDLGHFDRKGYLRVVGRASSLITLPGGENVWPEDVEERLQRSDLVRESGVLLHEEKLVALVVPERKEFVDSDHETIETRIRNEVHRILGELPSHHRVTDVAISVESLARTRLGKIRRHRLQDRYAQAKRGETTEAEAGPTPIEEMGTEHQALFDIPATREAWGWLIEHYPDRRIAPETQLEADLGIDSIEWLQIGLELQQRTGRALDEDVIGRVETVGDLLHAVAETGRSRAPEAVSLIDRLRDPERMLDEEQRPWLQRPGLGARMLRGIGLGPGRSLVRRAFRLKILGEEYLADQDQVVFVSNHRSYLDAPALGAAMPGDRLRRTRWAGARGIMLGTCWMRLISRAGHVVPVDPRGNSAKSLALAAAVLQCGENLVWFPEGDISRDGRLLPFQPGIAWLIQAQPTPVVPVWLEGTDRALPYGSWRVRLHPIEVRFGRPIRLEELPHGGDPQDRAGRIAEFLRERVARLGNDA